MSDARVLPTTGLNARVRLGVWVLHMALPVLGLWLLIAQPHLDVTWEHRPSHFWLVLSVAALNVTLSFQVLGAARLRVDVRLLLVGYAFMLAAGFLLLHALATPGVIVAQANSGFEIATPVGLALAAVFFGLASFDFTTETSNRVVALDSSIRWGLIFVMLGWGVVSLAELPPLTGPLPERAIGPLRWMAMAAIAAYLLAAIRFFLSHRRKPAVMLVALVTAATLLAEAMATIVWARNWHLSWWLWHLLMAFAFGFVAYSAYTQYRREGAGAGIFDGIVTRSTAEEMHREYGGALETLTDTLQRSYRGGMTEQDLDLVIAGLGTRFALTEGQTDVLARAARSLATERDQARRLGALALIPTETWVERNENDLLSGVVSIVSARLAPDVMRIALNPSDGLESPDRLLTGDWPEEGDRYRRDLTVGGEVAGVIDFARPFGQFEERDHTIMDTLVAEVGIALENVRLYAELDKLFRTYISPDVANTLKADPSRASLGGTIDEVTALFADLRGFTTFSEATDPQTVMELLNRYFGVAVPAILENGGTVVQFVGDALLAVFDAPTPRHDHEMRSVQAAMSMQEAIADIARDGDAPRFRIGINTGPALIGNIGSAELRSFNVVGDAVNIASRLETAAEPGTVVVGASTYQAIADRVVATPLGPIELKGKGTAVTAYRLDAVRPA